MVSSIPSPRQLWVGLAATALGGGRGRRLREPVQRASEWRRFLLAMQGKPIEEVRRALSSQLGSDWYPRSLADLDGLTKAFDEPCSK